ncbi:hypothetical protein G7054_g4394 [Neopestalotiopsis clavispora]|nr:hypothetical protein G7054_g4394 [Neopestalotiopsis clavispora]
MTMSSSSSNSVQDHLPRDIEKQDDQIQAANNDRSDVGGIKHSKEHDAVSDADDEDWAVEPEPDILNTDAEGVGGTIARVLSRISTNASWNPGPPPDGGWAAWMCAICGHFVIANTWGFINSFGVFQSYYTTLLGRPPSDISWIGSIQIFLTFFAGTFTGRITDAGFFRPILLLGTVLIALGIFTTSVGTQYWHFILSQGICMGLGNGCLFCPAISVVSTYFEKKRSLAIGITAAGSVTGGLVFPAMARQLLPSIGFGWTIRAIGFVQVGTLVITNCFMKSRLPPRRTGSIVEWGAFKEPEYVCFALGMFFNFWAVYFGFYYIASFSRTAIHPTLSYTDSLNLLLLMNGIGLIGRLLPNHFADTVGPLNIMIPTCLVTGIALLSWIAVHTPGQLYAWTVFYGVAAGGIQSLFPAGLSSLTTDLRKRGTRMGMTFTIVSFAVLTGNPIAGAIITAEGGGYVGAQVFTGVSILVGMALIFLARVSRQRKLQCGWRMKM